MMDGNAAEQEGRVGKVRIDPALIADRLGMPAGTKVMRVELLDTTHPQTIVLVVAHAELDSIGASGIIPLLTPTYEQTLFHWRATE